MLARHFLCTADPEIPKHVPISANVRATFSRGCDRTKRNRRRKTMEIAASNAANVISPFA